MHNHHSINQLGFLVFGRIAEEFLGGHPLGHLNAGQYIHGTPPSTGTHTLAGLYELWLLARENF